MATGDWRLADAMEIDARKDDEFIVNWATSEVLPLLHGITIQGRLRYLVYAEDLDAYENGDTLVVTTDLNGEVVARSDNDDTEEPYGSTLDARAARDVLKEYHESQIPPALVAGNNVQIPLIPENFQCA